MRRGSTDLPVAPICSFARDDGFPSNRMVSRLRLTDFDPHHYQFADKVMVSGNRLMVVSPEVDISLRE
jgi:hypothetical protein